MKIIRLLRLGRIRRMLKFVPKIKDLDKFGKGGSLQYTEQSRMRQVI